MLSWLEALLLGIVQGLTEFIPVSSSAHLAYLQILFGTKEVPLLYDLLLHLATLCSIFVVLRAELRSLIAGALRLPQFFLRLFQKGHLAIGDDEEAWTVVLILFATAVTGFIGVTFHDFLKSTFASLIWVSGTLLMNGLLLLFAGRKAEPKKGKTAARATLKDAGLIGLAQGLSILPGISRSGATIASALYLNFDRKFAGEFSFLMSIPAILGALVVESRHGFGQLGVPVWGAIFGFLASFIFGTLTLRLLLGWIRAGKLSTFAYYCLAVALFGFYLAFR
jgi:undecaprenyl-diphosphatase